MAELFGDHPEEREDGEWDVPHPRREVEAVEEVHVTGIEVGDEEGMGEGEARPDGDDDDDCENEREFLAHLQVEADG